MDSYKGNPIIKPQDLGLTWQENGRINIGAVFNGGAELFKGKIILMPRCSNNYKRERFFDEKLGIERYRLTNYISETWILSSEDGINFTRFKNNLIRGDGSDHKEFNYGIEDIRIIKHGQRYLLVGCGKIKPPFKGSNADRIAVYSTEDFENITYHGIVKSFDSRNCVPFPEEINGKQYVLLRFHPNIHLDPLESGIEQLLSPSKHIKQWEEIYNRKDNSLLLSAGTYPHEKEKIGPGPQVIKTDKGWLLLYHAVGEINESICKAYGLTGKIYRGYSICAALLDLENPQKIISRTRNPLYIPSFPYELNGNDDYPVDISAVVFPLGALVLKNKLFVYAGAGDKYTVLLSCNLDNLINYLLQYS